MFIATDTPADFVPRLLGRLPDCAVRPSEIAPVAAAALPPPAAALLDHPRHMTAVMEAHCGAALKVHVLDRVQDGARYAREILLVRPGGGAVQYAVVDIDLARCPDVVREGILAEQLPLGRVLLPLAEELRVAPLGFVKVGVPPALAALFGCAVQAPAYGRLLQIHHAGGVLIDGLELLAPTVLGTT